MEAERIGHVALEVAHGLVGHEGQRAAAAAEPMGLISRARDIMRERDPKRSALIEAYASAAFVEAKSEGDLKREAASIMADQSRRMTPADIAEANAKLSAMQPGKI